MDKLLEDDWAGLCYRPPGSQGAFQNALRPGGPGE